MIFQNSLIHDIFLNLSTRGVQYALYSTSVYAGGLRREQLNYILGQIWNDRLCKEKMGFDIMFRKLLCSQLPILLKVKSFIYQIEMCIYSYHLLF